MKVAAWFVGIVVLVSVVNMGLLMRLEAEFHRKYSRGIEPEFIVMNKMTSETLFSEISMIYGVKSGYYRNCKILVSEDLKNLEFKIG